MILRKVGQLLEHEPYLWHGFSRPDLQSERWELRIPVSIRDFRDVTTVEEYIDRVEQLVAPPELPSQPLSAAPLRERHRGPGVLEDVQKYLDRQLEPPAAAGCSDAIATLITLRTIRHGIEHGDARAKAVAAYAKLGLSFPVASWPQAWAQISAITCGALDVLREEAHAGLGDV